MWLNIFHFFFLSFFLLHTIYEALVQWMYILSHIWIWNKSSDPGIEHIWCVFNHHLVDERLIHTHMLCQALACCFCVFILLRYTMRACALWVCGPSWEPPWSHSHHPVIRSTWKCVHNTRCIDVHRGSACTHGLCRCKCYKQRYLIWCVWCLCEKLSAPFVDWNEDIFGRWSRQMMPHTHTLQ